MNSYRLVTYKEQNYIVCKYIKKNGLYKLFVIDEEDLPKISENTGSWYEINEYIGSVFRNKKGEKMTSYLHNVVMDKPVGGGKGQRYTIDHINRIKTDNRKENLRLVTQSDQNENRTGGGGKRTCQLPKDCGISPEDIPKCAYYRGPQPDGHGDKFVIELTKNGVTKQYETTTSKDVPLLDKLAECIKILLDINKNNPELVENKNIIIEYTNKQIKLMKQYNDIIQLSGYKCADSNMIKIKKTKPITYDIPGVTKKMKEYLDNTDTTKKTGRCHKIIMPRDCKITPNMIPKHCYYRAAKGNRGDSFVIDRHPKLPKGVRQWSTTTSKKVSTNKKFKELQSQINFLKENKKLKPKVTTKKISGSKTSRVVKK